MPVRGDTQINSFVKGLVTEASPLSFPPNTALDILNFKLQKDGTNYRRLGLDFEDDYLLTATGYSTDVLATARKAFYHWPLPNGNPLVDIGVVQIGAKFWFLNLYAENPSSALLNGGSPVTSTVDPSSRFSFAVINNYLLVVSNNLPDPYLVSYNATTDVITFESSSILVRDLWGVDDGLSVGQRPTSLTPAHYYNLLNQGWANNIVTTCGAGISPVDCTFSTLGLYPSNSDVWTIGRIGDLTSADIFKYDPNIAARNIFDIGQVPQGHYIVPFKSRGQSRFEQTGLTVPLDREVGTISCVAAYAGRAFYSGILSQIEDGDNRSPTLSGAVLFSQTFEQPIDLVKCYQEADPTSPDISDIIDTDGGIIFIPECSVINHLRAVNESLFVFAINGIWEIRGDEGGFRATSFQAKKISNVGVYSPDSIVEINGQVLFWGINGIYAIAQNQFGIYETTSLTQPTIQKMYNSIPDFARSQAKGFYDLNNNTVRWLFYSDDAKVAGQPIDVTPPSVEIMAIGAAAEASSTGDIEPKIMKLSSTTVLLIYRNTGSTLIKGRIGTIADDLSITYGTQQTLVNSSSLTALNLTYLETNKVLLNYMQSTNCTSRVLNISGDTITVKAATVVNTQSNSTYLTKPIRSALVSASKALICFSNTDNSKASLQILSIDASDVVTAGAVAKGVDLNMTGHNLALLSATAGVVVSFDTRARMETFSISGTTVTFSGISNTFPTTTQIPAPTTFNMGGGFIHPIDSTRVLVTGVTSTSSPTISNAMYSFVGTISGTAVTSTTILKQDLELGTVPVNLLFNNKSVVVYRKNISGTDYTPRILLNNVGGSTPIPILQTNSITAKVVGAPEATTLIGNKIVIAFEGGVTGTEITAVAANLV